MGCVFQIHVMLVVRTRKNVMELPLISAVIIIPRLNAAIWRCLTMGAMINAVKFARRACPPVKLAAGRPVQFILETTKAYAVQ